MLFLSSKIKILEAIIQNKANKTKLQRGQAHGYLKKGKGSKSLDVTFYIVSK